MRWWAVLGCFLVCPLLLLADVDSSAATDAISEGMAAVVAIFQVLIVAFSVIIGYRMVLSFLREEGYVGDQWGPDEDEGVSPDDLEYDHDVEEQSRRDYEV